MIEKIVLDYLLAKLNIDAIYLDIPAKHPDTYIAFRKVDSEITNHIEGATLEFNVYGQSKYACAVLDDQLKKAMLGDGSTDYGILELATIASCKYGGGSDSPATDVKAYRYRSFYNFTY